MQVSYDFYTENGTSGQSERRHDEGKFMGNILGGTRDYVHAAISYKCAINKPTTVELCISPVYRRLAVSRFFKVHNVEIAHVTLTTLI